MRFLMTAKNPEQHEYTMTATLTLKEWSAIRKDLEASSRSPIWEFRQCIDEAVSQAEKEYRASAESVDKGTEK